MTIDPISTDGLRSCTISVPASTANLGPGFDSMGCAVALRNQFRFTITDRIENVVTLQGPGSAGIPLTGDNLAISTLRNFLNRHGFTAPGIHLNATINVPNSRGLGSSSTAIVAGLGAGNCFLKNKLSIDELLDEAVRIEGHPDNVAPAMLGGLVIAASQSEPLSYTRLRVHPSIRFLFIVPDYMVKTSEARKRIPKSIAFSDAIFNASRSPLVAIALQSGDMTTLRVALEDTLHTNHRKDLFRSYDDLKAAALNSGAAGFCVSGAGPTMLALCTDNSLKAVTLALSSLGSTLPFRVEIHQIQPDHEGMISE